MKHATDLGLDALEALLAKIRAYRALREKARGVFYRRSKAFLHFHEDPAGLFADLRASATWERFPVNTGSERRVLLRRIRDALSVTRRR
jgi:hypothetical protein